MFGKLKTKREKSIFRMGVGVGSKRKRKPAKTNKSKPLKSRPKVSYYLDDNNSYKVVGKKVYISNGSYSNAPLSSGQNAEFLRYVKNVPNAQRKVTKDVYEKNKRGYGSRNVY